MKTTSFGKFAHVWDTKTGDKGVVSSEETINAIMNLLGSVKERRIYEIATGNGFFARKLIRAGAKEVYASDIARKLIEIAKIGYDSAGITYLVREATDFSTLPKSTFDAVVIHKGIFYIKDIDQIFKGIRSILKPHGVLVFDIRHPLFPLFRQSIGETRNPLEEAEDYLKIRSKTLKKTWEGEEVSYLQYQRPLSYYVNLCGQHGLLIETIVEPPSKTVVDKKIRKSKIPGWMIIKARRL